MRNATFSSLLNYKYDQVEHFLIPGTNESDSPIDFALGALSFTRRRI
jgi:hypothetical protein